MKHVKLFEQFSSLPVDYTKEQIEKMSRDEFLNALEKYKLADDAEQAITLSSIWLHANKEAVWDRDFVDKLGDYMDFMMPTIQNKRDIIDAIQKGDYDKELAIKRIPESERSIKHYETMLSGAKNRRGKLKSSLGRSKSPILEQQSMSPMVSPLVYLIWTDEEGIQSPFILKADSEKNAVLELDKLMGGDGNPVENDFITPVKTMDSMEHVLGGSAHWFITKIDPDKFSQILLDEKMGIIEIAG